MALVEDIIRLSQLDEGQEEMEKKPVELFTLAKDCLLYTSRCV